MAIDLATGFNIGSKDAIDERQVLTLEQMKNLDESIYPDKYFAICKDNGKLYLYNVNNIVDSETGKFRVLEGTSIDGTTDSAYTTVVFDKIIDMGKYFLLAKITNANYANNIIKFSCPNFKGQNDVGFKYEDDVDILKFELHFNTGATRETNSYGVTLKQHGLGLYSYPLNNPQNTSPEIKDAIRLYWDYSKGEIYVFLVELMTAIPHCVLEYTGNGTLLRENTFINDDLYNRLDGANGTWEESKWKSIPYNKLETPPIYELGGDGGSVEGTPTYDDTKKTLITNTANLKLDVTKKKSSYFGAIKLTYLYDTSPAEVEITFRSATDDLRWTIVSGQKYINNITFTQDSENAAHYTIGVEFSGTTYGCYQVEVIGGFADLNSLTKEAFTGDKTAVYKTPHGKNNGVTLISELKDLGLTAPCTTAQIAKAMRDITTGTIRTSLIGILDGNNTIITDAPSIYGTLIIHAHGYDGIDIRYTGISGHSATDTWIGKIKANNTSSLVFESVTWEKIYVETESKKEEDSYIPDMYDRNANGDIPVVGFDRLVNLIAIRQNGGLVSTTETEETYNEDYVGGYVFSGANDILIKDKEMFNKIKVLVHIPGVLRIGIVNEKIYEANPRYSTCLVKWLVADFVAFTGMKEYDIEDTVLEEGQSIFLECRVGVSSWYLNTGEAKQVGAITYPASSCTTGLNIADKLDTTTKNALFKSQKVNSSSCLTAFGNNMYSIGGRIRGNFANRAYTSGATSSKEGYENSEYYGGLNIGLYRRTKYSDTRFCKCVENAMSPTLPLLSNYVRLWFSTGQEALEGKSVYAIKLDVHTPGNLTICRCKGTTVDDFQIIDKYTHYVRAKGLQTIHLPFDIKLGKGEYIGIGGFHCKSTADNIVVDTCKWHYFSVDEISTCSWMNTIGKTGFYSICLDPTQYPEVCTTVSSLNRGCLNVEIICRGEKRSPLEDKYISFTGDSITTFTGFCTTKTGYPEGNPAGDNAVYYPASGKVINNVDATWWGILARDNRMKILRNDAWSGSRVSSSEGSTDTRCLCGDKRRYYLRNGYAYTTDSTYPFGRPEIIVSMIGTNDLSGGVDLGTEMFRGISGAEEEYKTILSAFSLFCRRIHDQEGNGGTKIVHFLIPRGSDYGYANANGVTIADLSLHFERIAKAYGQYFIPLSYFNGIKPNAPKRWSCPTGSMFKNTSGTEFPSADGLHPNVMGMEVIADGVHRFLCSIM